jgi:hypothetical protein
MLPPHNRHAPNKRALSSGSRRRTCAHLLFHIGIVMKRLMALSGPLVPPLRGCRPCGCLLHSLCRAVCAGGLGFVLAGGEDRTVLSILGQVWCLSVCAHANACWWW